ncbi:hypothetical protein [Aquiflexum sp.]|uniref:hypothetical protein n=1 Tax=Aquiflexum sp. TaxID=1872584 RepID=UPI0035940569
MEHKLNETKLLYSRFQNGETEIASCNTFLGGADPKLVEPPNWEEWLQKNPKRIILRRISKGKSCSTLSGLMAFSTN